MKRLSFLLACFMTCFVMSCSSDPYSGPSNADTNEAKYTQGG